ncbi:L-asparagine permease [Psychromicrobium silvestre]|uniref:L-asparagine permease n=1 Tax=Psychromicrobium silvestre TaxID=1645614 RepID=A0A7Y9LTG8_9MICC|nr:amino acid permease [Psychromicrobium silvestre]NYE95333.1 L-asparagine permease [Psychromicrobium silvestre]
MESPAQSSVTPAQRNNAFDEERKGYKKALKPRQIQMMALGSAIGSGLFMGSGGRLASVGPSLFIAFAICGVFSFFVVRALGELIAHRPTSGSYISYAREFLGERTAFVAGWLYFLMWATAAVADITAVALYAHFWSAFTSVPQWALALIALVLVLLLNLLSVKIFGELEYWFALIKVGTLTVFLIVGAVVLAAAWPLRTGTESVTPGIHLWAENGGIFPAGVLATVLVIQGVIFAFSGTELVGTAAGEAQNPEKTMPKAIRSVIYRIAIFYVGSILLLTLLLPFTAYQAGQSPFVTFFASLGNGQFGQIAGSAMNFVVLTAALSSLNAGLYSTGRILRSMSLAGSAPRFTAKMNRAGVPYGGILLTVVFAILGVVLNLFIPSQAFEIMLNLAAIGVISAWVTILLCQIRLRQRAQAGLLQRPAFRLPGAPATAYISLVFYLGVFVLMCFDYPSGTWTVGTFVVIGIPLLIVGWFASRKRIFAIAEGVGTEEKQAS